MHNLNNVCGIQYVDLQRRNTCLHPHKDIIFIIARYMLYLQINGVHLYINNNYKLESHSPTLDTSLMATFVISFIWC